MPEKPSEPREGQQSDHPKKPGITPTTFGELIFAFRAAHAGDLAKELDSAQVRIHGTLV
jgi:hypothetical protein